MNRTGGDKSCCIAEPSRVWLKARNKNWASATLEHLGLLVPLVGRST
jgi:hypothetical protein